MPIKVLWQNNMKLLMRVLMGLGACIFAIGGGHAQSDSNEHQALGSISKAVHDYLRVQTAGLPGTATYTVGALDPRLVLPACPALELFLPAGARLWDAVALALVVA